MNDNWYYYDHQGNQQGPVPVETIEIMIEDGLLHRASLVWQTGMQEWKPAGELGCLYPSDKNAASPTLKLVPKTSETPADKTNSDTRVSTGTLEEAKLIRNIARHEHRYGVLWTILGILQILSIAGLIAGIWNIVASREHFRRSREITDRCVDIPESFKDQSGLWLQMVINIVFGGMVGVFLSLYGFHIRKKVMNNAYLFTGQPQRLSLAA